MFRGATKSEINDKYFGAGSVLVAGPNQYWLLVSGHDGTISLLNLKTFELSKNYVTVGDVYFLTEEEARVVTDLTGLHYAFSDFTIDAKGLKGAKHNFKY